MHTGHILDSHYEKSDLSQVTEENKYLSKEYPVEVHTLLTKYKLLFDITLGTCTNKHV